MWTKSRLSPSCSPRWLCDLDNGFHLAKAQSSLLLIRATNGNGGLRTKWGDADEVPCTVPGNGEHSGNVSNHGSCHLARGLATRAVASPTTSPAWPVPSTCLWLGVSARNSLFTTLFTYTWLSDQCGLEILWGQRRKQCGEVELRTWMSILPSGSPRQVTYPLSLFIGKVRRWQHMPAF